MNPSKTPKLTRVRTITKRWTSEEELNILWYIKEEDEIGRKFEKPFAKVYYENLIKNVAIQDANYSQLKNKIANMRKTFSKAQKWLKDTGNGISIEGPLEGSIAAYVYGICPHYNLLQEIFAQKVNVVIPFDFDTPRRSVVQNIIAVPASSSNLEEHDIISTIVIPPSDAEVPFESFTIDLTNMSATQQEIGQFLLEETTSSDNQDSVAPVNHNVAPDQNITGENNVDNQDSVAPVNHNVAPDQNITGENNVDNQNNEPAVEGSNHNTVPAINRNNVTTVKRNSRSIETIVEEDDLLVCRFKKDLLASVPCKKHKSIPSNAAAHISDANLHRAEALKERNVIDMKRVDNDELHKSAELEISKERLRLEKEFQLGKFELMKFEQENLNDKNLIDKVRLEKEHEISKKHLAMETEFRLKELDLQTSQQEKLNEQNMIDRQRLESEINVKKDKIQLKKDRFLFEKEVRLQELDLEKIREQNRQEIEKLKLEYQYKVDLEIAKQNRAN